MASRRRANRVEIELARVRDTSWRARIRPLDVVVHGASPEEAIAAAFVALIERATTCHTIWL